MTNSTGTRFNRGEIWVAKVAYYEDPARFKPRPVVIVSDMIPSEQNVAPIVVPITKSRPRNQLDVPIQHWRESGLVTPSTARVSKLITIHQNRMIFKIGTLHEEDLQKILVACRSLFA